MINISNCTSKDNPRSLDLRTAGSTSSAGAPTWTAASHRSAGARLGHLLAAAAGVPASWLAYALRRCGDRWFAMNDNEAYWRGWQISKTHAGLGRRYRDPRFDMLASCARCAGAGVYADAPCGPCLGTGRVTLWEVS